jgi:hypothetical protein
VFCSDTPRDFTSQTSASATSKDEIPSAGTPRDFTSQISATLKGEIPCDSGTFAMVYHRTVEYNEGMVEVCLTEFFPASSNDYKQVAVKVFKIGPQAGRDLKKINKVNLLLLAGVPQLTIILRSMIGNKSRTQGVA